LIKQYYASIPTIHQNPIHVRNSLNEQDDRELGLILYDKLVYAVIEVSRSPWCSPASAITGEDGKRKLNVDYKYLNAITVDLPFDLIRMTDLIRSMEQSDLFTLLSIAEPYHQIPLDAQSKLKAAFDTSCGNFQFATLDENMKNSKKYLQLVLRTILEPIDGSYFKIFEGQILIHTLDNYDLHLVLLREILFIIHRVNFKLDVNESLFVMPEINFKGFHFNSEGTAIIDEMKLLIYSWSYPATFQTLKKQLDIFDHYRSHMPDDRFYADHVKPLNTHCLLRIFSENPVQEMDLTDELKYHFLCLKLVLFHSGRLSYQPRRRFLTY